MSDSKSVACTRLNSLDGLRIVMVLVVVFSHFDFMEDILGDWYTIFLKRGDFAVDYFFILSGFGIFYTNGDKNYNCTIRDSIDFSLKRIRKIYPVYLISLCLGLFYFIPLYIIPINSLVVGFGKTVLCVVLNISLTQSITGMTIFSHAINGVCWYLSTVFISYMFCPMFINLVKKIKGKVKTIIGYSITLVTILCMSFIAILIEESSVGERFDDLFYGHPFVRCFYLLLGMFLASIYLKNESTGKNASVIEIIECIVYISYFLSRNIISNYVDVILIRLFDVLITSSLIFIFASAKGKIGVFLSKGVIKNMGNNAMYIFLFHYPVLMIVEAIDRNDSLIKYFGEWSYLIKIIAILVGTVFITWCLKNLKKIIKHNNDSHSSEIRG